MTTQTPRYVFVQNIDGTKKQIIAATSQIAIKKDNYSAQQTFAQPEAQYVYQTNPIQSSAQMSQTSDYNPTSLIKIEKVDSLRNVVPRVVASTYKASTSRRSLPSTTVTLASPLPSYKKTDKKRNEKPGKGLRHFSMRVCQKVKEKGVTSYNEVADELVAEESEDAGAGGSGSYDQKNIRRRVYDALNVLMAMNIISKEKKEIKWIGLPTSSAQECEEMEVKNQQARERIQEKQQQLRELILKHVSFKSLIERNKDLEKRGIVPSPSSAVQLPFIVINTNKKTHINCNISNDKREYLLKFDDKFEVQDDFEVLKRMGLLLGLDKGESRPEDIEKLKKLVPKPYQKYIEMYATEDDMTMTDQTQSSYSPEESTQLETLDAEYLDEDAIEEGI